MIIQTRKYEKANKKYDRTLRLKKDIVIPAGTIFGQGPSSITMAPDCHVEHTLGFGKNAAGILLVGHELGDDGFLEWFELAPCSACGQTPDGQTGEYPCPKCGLPLMHDSNGELVSYREVA